MRGSKLANVVLLMALGCAVGPRVEPVPTAATTEAIRAEAPALTGRILDHDGAPLPAASIELAGWQRHRIAYLQPGPDGAFTIDTSFRGLAQITINAPGYRMLRMSLLLDGTPLALDARLGTYSWKTSPTHVVAQARFGPVGHNRQLELELQPDGTWATTVIVSAEDREAARVAAAQPPPERKSTTYPTWDPELAKEMERASTVFLEQRRADSLGPDELGYLVSGVTDGRDWWLAGTHADRLSVTDGRSVVKVDGGQVRVVFDPKRLPPAGLEPEVRITPTTSPAVAIAQATLHADRWREIHERALTNGLGDGAAVDAMLEQARRDAERNPLDLGRHAMLMQALGLATLTAHDESEAYPPMARELLRVLPPSDPLWSMTRDVLSGALGAVDDPDLADYGERALAEHADHEVLASLLASRLYDATVAGDTETARSVWARLHDERFGQTQIAGHAGGMDPDRASAPGKPVPGFSVRSLDDPNVRITETTLAGKPYLLALWATWCRPCVVEMPEMHEAYERLHERHGLEILAISFDEDPRSVAELRKTWPMPWTHAIATTKEERDAINDALAASGLPTHLLVGADGRVLADDVLLRGEDLERFVSARLSP